MFFLERDVASKATNESHISEMFDQDHNLYRTEIMFQGYSPCHINIKYAYIMYFGTLYVLHNFSIGISPLFKYVG